MSVMIDTCSPWSTHHRVILREEPMLQGTTMRIDDPFIPSTASVMVVTFRMKGFNHNLMALFSSVSPVAVA